MKKRFFVLAAAVLLLSVSLIGCGQKITAKQSELQDFREIENDKGFLIKEKKLNYGEEDLVIITAENKNEAAKSILLIVTYKNEDGSQIEKENVMIEGVAPGDTETLLLRPGFAFAQHSYSMITDDYKGTAKKSVEAIKFGDLSFTQTTRYSDTLAWDNDLTAFPTLMGKIEISNTEHVTYNVAATVILIDGNGEVYGVYSSSAFMPPDAWGGTIDFVVYQPLEGEFLWPRELNENASYYIIYDAVDVSERS